MGVCMNKKTLILNLSIEISHPGFKEDFKYIEDETETALQNLQCTLQEILDKRFGGYSTFSFKTPVILNQDNNWVEH